VEQPHFPEQLTHDVCCAREAVFSGSEDRIRAKKASVEVAAALPVSPAANTGLRRLAESLVAVLFPSDCRLCGLPRIRIFRLPVCEMCGEHIRPVQGRLCSICDERILSPYVGYVPAEELVCPICRRIRLPFAAAVAYGSYDGGLRELIHRLKYDGVRAAANVLGRMLGEVICRLELLTVAQDGGGIVVIPVPLHKTRLRQRGFNQAESIARAALKSNSALKHLHLARHVLERRRETNSQIGLTGHQPRENMRGAFVVAYAKKIGGPDVILLDDVYTTGTTVSECARVLRKAGASRVWVANVARTLKLASHSIEMKPIAEDSAKEGTGSGESCRKLRRAGFKVSGFQSFRKRGLSRDFETLKL